MEISNLPEDLVEEIFCKLPVTSMGAVRLTCKKWNTISKNQSFAEKHTAAAGRELSVIMVIGQKVCLMELRNFNGIPSINRKSQLVRLENNADQVDISGVLHCDGLLLCITKQERLVVWNPYWGQTRWITPRNSYQIPYNYFMGYEVMNNTRSHKILRFIERHVDMYRNIQSGWCEIYDFKYNSWRTLDITVPYWDIQLRQLSRGVSVKGNTYWCGKKHIGGAWQNFLICFDFTREKCGPHLSLPCARADNVGLSSVREEKLVVLVQRWDTLEMEIWVTSEIEPTMVSWSKVFLTVEKISKYFPLDSYWSTYRASIRDESFLIDEENKVVVFIDKDKETRRRNIAIMFGVGGYLGEEDLGEFTSWLGLFFPYVPTSVHIK